MGWLDKLNVNKVQHTGNNFGAQRIAFRGGEEETQTGARGWEQYHNGQGPNGLNAFPDEYSGKKFNAYF